MLYKGGIQCRGGHATKITLFLGGLALLLLCCRGSCDACLSLRATSASFTFIWSPGLRVGAYSSTTALRQMPPPTPAPPAHRNFMMHSQKGRGQHDSSRQSKRGESPLCHGDGDGDICRKPRASRRKFLENGARSAAAGVGFTAVSNTRRHVARLAGGIGWGFGRAEGVQSAEAFGGPSKPLSRCLVNAVNAREFCKRLEGQLAAGNNVQQCRGMVKSILRDLSLQECIKDAVLYLPASKRQAAADVGQSAVEYLASVVEFDAWDKLDKDWTSNVALRNMTPENVAFVRLALDAAGAALDQFFGQFDRGDVIDARNLYRAYFVPVEERESSS